MIIGFLAFHVHAQKLDAEIYTGDQLKYIGKTVGGITAGQVYLGG